MGERFFIDTFIFSIAVCVTIGNPAAIQNDQEVVTITLLEEGWSSAHREKRTADSNFPDRLAFSVPVKGEAVLFRMTKSKLLPVVMSHEDRMRAASGLSENGAVYTDVSMTSAMIVKRAAEHYTLKGSFVHKEVLWNLEHTKYRGTEGGIRHRIVPQATSETISYVGDDIVFKENTIKENDTDEERYEDLVKQNSTTKGLKTANQHRLRRSIIQHVVKVAFVADFADYSKWRRYAGVEAAIREMRLWYTYVADSINVRYATIKDPDMAIKIDVTVLKILDTPRDARFLMDITNQGGQLPGEKGLTVFLKWHKRQRDIPESHHYMLFTGLDIAGISGLAYVGRLCTEEGISIVENSFDGNVGNTAAHELGHSISAKHDDNIDKGSGCTYDDQYIMAPAFKKPVAVGNEGHPWRFSACSVRAFKAFLTRSTCQRKNKIDKDVLPAGESELRPGEVLTKDDQCRQYFQNRSSYFCQDTQDSNGGMARLCGGMFCSIPHSETVCRTVIPQEFTNCGKNKWCVTGQCVDKFDNTAATPTETTAAAETTATPEARRTTAITTYTRERALPSTPGTKHSGSTTTRSVQTNSRFPAVTSNSVKHLMATTSTNVNLNHCDIFLLLGDTQSFYNCRSSVIYQHYPYII